jgi:hypothetical protein
MTEEYFVQRVDGNDSQDEAEIYILNPETRVEFDFDVLAGMSGTDNKRTDKRGHRRLKIRKISSPLIM